MCNGRQLVTDSGHHGPDLLNGGHLWVGAWHVSRISKYTDAAARNGNPVITRFHLEYSLLESPLLGSDA